MRLDAGLRPDSPKLLQLGSAGKGIIRSFVRGNAKTFAGPGADIQVLAALRTKRPERVGEGVHTLAATARASDDARFAAAK